jgi:quercetin dioxygenase-like cupin family protein
MNEPSKGPPVTAATLRHVYVALAVAVAVVALIAAAFNGSSRAGSDGQVVPTGERAEQYYKRLVTLGRGLTVSKPLAVGLLPALPHGGSTLTDGTKFILSYDKPIRVTFLTVKLVPGASLPWHRHTAPILISLIRGKVVDYRADRPGCAGKVISPGRAQFEPNAQIHTLTNPFKKPAFMYVVTWSAKGVDPSLHEEKVPPGCPAHPERG